MKVKETVLLSFVLIVGIALTAYGQPAKSAPASSDNTIKVEEINYSSSPVNKLGRGLVNTATFWAEIPGQMCKVSKEKDPFTGSTLGLVQGVFTSVIRGVTGIFDTVTFAFPPYDKPIMQPEYAYQSLDDNVKEYLLW